MRNGSRQNRDPSELVSVHIKQGKGFMTTRILTTIAIVAMLLIIITPSRAQTSRRCFVETGYCIEGRIREFWEQNGSLAVFGFPITPQHDETVEAGTFQTQWFERTRLELHPENAPPYDVQIGRLGVERLAQQGRNWQDFPTSSIAADCRTFSVTGHSICGLFRSYWESHGLTINEQPGVSEDEALALFGLPISDMHIEEIDGVAYQTQWFERARLELHPENAPPYDVLMGLLGHEVRAVRLVTPTPTQPPRPSPPSLPAYP
jgi:hypothetical protein